MIVASITVVIMFLIIGLVGVFTNITIDQIQDTEWKGN